MSELLLARHAARREHVLAELLECLYTMLRGDYLRFCSSAFTGTSSWQEQEVGLYAIRWVSPCTPGHGGFGCS